MGVTGHQCSLSRVQSHQPELNFCVGIVPPETSLKEFILRPKSLLLQLGMICCRFSALLRYI